MRKIVEKTIVENREILSPQFLEGFLNATDGVITGEELGILHALVSGEIGEAKVANLITILSDELLFSLLTAVIGRAAYELTITAVEKRNGNGDN